MPTPGRKAEALGLLLWPLLAVTVAFPKGGHREPGPAYSQKCQMSSRLPTQYPFFS